MLSFFCFCYISYESLNTSQTFPEHCVRFICLYLCFSWKYDIMFDLFWHQSKFNIIWGLIYDDIRVIDIFGGITRLKTLLKSYYLSIPSAGEHLRICPQGYTCCTSAMEETLSNLSRREFEGLVREAGRSIQASLNAQYRTFDSESKMLSFL